MLAKRFVTSKNCFDENKSEKSHRKNAGLKKQNSDILKISMLKTVKKGKFSKQKLEF